MAKLLLLSDNFEICEQVKVLCAKHEFFFRSVSTAEHARQRLSMESYDVLVLDVISEPVEASDLVELAWKYSPNTTPALIATEDPDPVFWKAGLLGTKVFFGDSAIEKLDTFLAAIPKDLELHPELKVLFVDDLDAPREIICAYMQSLGFKQVDAVANGEDALRLLKDKRGEYFCVIADLHMPKMNGLQLTKEIRANAKIENIPVVILTADPTAENVIDCIKAGASGFLAKPPKKRDLLRELEKAQRIIKLGESARLCEEKDAEVLEKALRKRELSHS